MSPLTDRQRNLLNLANQLSQNIISPGENSLNHNASVNIPGLGLNVDHSLGIGGTETPPTPPEPEPPTTLRDVLLSLVNEQVEVTTPFDMVTGTLLLVRDDYVVVVENTGAQVLVRIDKIELVNEL
ncbi:DUF2642 domain-containing protein [Virgibacillus oceani]